MPGADEEPRDLGNLSDERPSVDRLGPRTHPLSDHLSLGDRRRSMIRVRRNETGIAVELAALMPIELFFPQVSNRGGPSNSEPPTGAFLGRCFDP